MLKAPISFTGALDGTMAAAGRPAADPRDGHTYHSVGNASAATAVRQPLANLEP